MKTMSMLPIWLRGQRCIADLLADCRGIAATEFAVIVPLMLVLFFGVVEFSSGVAVDRKVTLIARTVSDLTSQSPPPSTQSPSATILDSDLQNIFTASISVMYPYPPAPTKVTVSEIYIDSNSTAKIQWSKAATIAANATQATLTASTRNPGDVVTSTVPTSLLTKQTYLIFSEVRYLYVPTVDFGGLMSTTGVNLNDVAFARPRQVVCVIYNNLPASNPTACPTP